jgi:20S proteasome subunit beta 2
MLQVRFLQVYNSKEMMRRELELQRLNTGRENRVISVSQRLSSHLFRYMGHIGTGLIIGGVDTQGSHLISVSPHGNTMHLPYITTGSGSLAAMAIMET